MAGQSSRQFARLHDKCGPGLGLPPNVQPRVIELNMGVEFLEVKMGRDLFILQGEDDLDQSRNSGGRFQVADVGLD
jgi:hypothetical protein